MSRPTFRPGSPATGLGRAAALPALEMLAIRLLQILDLFWLGKVGSVAMAALAIGSSLRWGLSSLAMGLGIGGMMAVGQRLGERDEKAASVAAWQTIILCLAAAAVLSAAGLALAVPMLRLLGTGEDVFPASLSYLRISSLGLIPALLVYTVNALWRGTGEAGKALATLGLATGLSLALEPPLVLGWGPFPRLGAAGSALATALGQTLGAIVQCFLLARDGRLCLRWDTLYISLPLMARIIGLSAPSTAQMVLRSLSRATLVGIVGWFGAAALAAYATANGILMAVLIPCHLLGNVAATLSVENLGHGCRKQALRTVWLAAIVDAGYMALAVAALFACAPQFIAALNPHPEVVDYGANALRIIGLGYLSSSLGMIMARGLDGIGSVVPAAAISVITLWGVEVPTAFLLSRLLGATGIWLAIALGGVANGVLLSYRFRRGWWSGEPGQRTPAFGI